MSKVAVTGGAGFVGTNLVRTLLYHGHEVVVVDNFSTGLKSNIAGLDCEVFETSILNYKQLQKAFIGCDHIFHLAARGSVPRSLKNPRATFDVNLKGTLNVLECARSLGAKLTFSSSSSVYGSNLSLPKTEEMYVAPLTPYAASKLAGEGLVQSYSASFGVQANTFRFFNIYGPWQRPDHQYAAVIPKWIWKLINGEIIEIYGDGNQSRDFTYIDTVVEILLESMQNFVSRSTPINLAYGSKISLNETIELLSRKFDKPRVSYLSERLGDVKNSQNDPSLLQRLFPMITPVEFQEGIEKTINWFLESGNTIAHGSQVVD